jgi:hypothetical protein
MSDPDRLAEIRQRRAAITPPPWGWADSDTDEELDAAAVASGEHPIYLHGAEWGDDLERGSVVLPTDWRFVAHNVEEIERADAEFIVHAPADIDHLLGSVERLRRFPAVWAVRYGNYDPSEVIALYDNEEAARAHAAMSTDPLEVEEMEVRNSPPRLSGGPLSS